MTFPKLLASIAVFLFAIIGITILFKGNKEVNVLATSAPFAPLEIELDTEIRLVSSSQPSQTPLIGTVSEPLIHLSQEGGQQSYSTTHPLPQADRIAELFNKVDPRLPIVETIVYKSRVPWQKGRPAWLSDYASHYATSRHFIARSLNGKSDYFKQDIGEGDRFNVLRPGKQINFYLLIDTSRSKMWFYYVDVGTNERVLLKTYTVGLGRLDSSKPSGMLTPLGKYSLGSRVAIYKPKTTGFYNGIKTEMIRIFGTRWLPFDKELGTTTAPAAGFGIHGVPWTSGDEGELAQDLGSLGKYESDGCIRLATADIEELFAIVITKPTVVELVKDFYEAKLPGIEKDVN